MLCCPSATDISSILIKLERTPLYKQTHVILGHAVATTSQNVIDEHWANVTVVFIASTCGQAGRRVLEAMKRLKRDNHEESCTLDKLQERERLRTEYSDTCPGVFSI